MSRGTLLCVDLCCFSTWYCVVGFWEGLLCGGGGHVVHCDLRAIRQGAANFLHFSVSVLGAATSCWRQGLAAVKQPAGCARLQSLPGGWDCRLQGSWLGFAAPVHVVESRRCSNFRTARGAQGAHWRAFLGFGSSFSI